MRSVAERNRGLHLQPHLFVIQLAAKASAFTASACRMFRRGGLRRTVAAESGRTRCA